MSLKATDPLSRAKIIARLQLLAKENPAQALDEASTLLRDATEKRWDVRVSALRAIDKAGAAAVAALLLERLPSLDSWSLKREALLMLATRLEQLDQLAEQAALAAFKDAASDKNSSVAAVARASLLKAGLDPGPERHGGLSGGPARRTTGKRAQAAFEKAKPALGWTIWIASVAWVATFLFYIGAGIWSQAQGDAHLSNDQFTLGWMIFMAPVGIGLIGGACFLAVYLSWHLKGKLVKKAVTNVERPSETFADIAGIDESMAEIAEVLAFLKNPDQYKRLGGRPPRGVLLVGPPGTGKTLLAKALAGETKTSFISANGSEFINVFAGMGARNVRAKFALARQHSPAILFIDEIDSIASKRHSTTDDGGSQEHLQTINALLAEMDGFGGNENVIVIGATNRLEALDLAARRPGRFDRIVHVELPDALGRESILQVHAEKVRLAPEVDLRQIAAAQRTGGMSGAYLANIINEAAAMAGRRGAGEIAMKDMIEASDRETMGQARGLLLSSEEKLLIAHHEAGHALVQIALGGAVDKATIIPRGKSGGHVRITEAEDRGTHSISELKKRMAMAMGGIAGERLLRAGDHTSGPASDLQNVTAIAQRMVAQWGMGRRTGFIVPAEDNFPLSERQLHNMELDRDELVNEAIATAERILSERRGDWERLAAALIAEETLTGDQIEALLNASAAAQPTR